MYKETNANQPIITLLFKDRTQAKIVRGCSTGGLTDEEGSLSNLEKIIVNIKCTYCGTITKTLIEQIDESGSDERQMGMEIYYNARGAEACKRCNNIMEVDIELTTYAYDTDFHNYISYDCKLA